MPKIDIAAVAKRIGQPYPLPSPQVPAVAIILINRSNRDAVYLEIGSRLPIDVVTCPDIDMQRSSTDGASCTRRRAILRVCRKRSGQSVTTRAAREALETRGPHAICW